MYFVRRALLYMRQSKDHFGDDGPRRVRVILLWQRVPEPTRGSVDVLLAGRAAARAPPAGRGGVRVLGGGGGGGGGGFFFFFLPLFFPLRIFRLASRRRPS